MWVGAISNSKLASAGVSFFGRKKRERERMEEDVDKMTAALYTVRKRSVEIPLEYLLSGMIFLSG